MNKRIKWGIIILIGAGLAGLGIYQFTPHENKELTAADALPKENKQRTLKVNAQVIKPHLLTDEILVTGRLVPDEEVSLSFETSGKITDIFFTEGTLVKRGELLAKVNDRQLQAQLKRLEAQIPLAEDRVFRQNALLKRDAVSKEAYEQVKTELATLNADIENIKANIDMTELRAPFDGIIGLRQVSTGAYASPTTVVARLTKVTPLKVEFAVPERYAREIKKGTNLEFKVEGKLDTYHAQVYATESSIDMETHSLNIRAIYPNRNGELLAGRYADIQLKQKEIAKYISCVYQENEAPDDITVRDLVSFGRNIYSSVKKEDKEENKRMIDFALKATGIEEIQDKKVVNLSGGQKQRAFIAMSLAQNTEVLLLDEPTTYLDIYHQIEILEVVKSLNEK